MRYALLLLTVGVLMAGSYTVKTDFKNAAYTPRGAALALFSNHDPEVILSGPADTGKTLACCWKAHLLCCKYPGCQGAIVGKEYSYLPGSVLQTFKRVIAGAPVEIYGGEKPEKYIYSNGSVIWIGGLDNPQKTLSSERDFVYPNQAERMTLNDHELLTRCTTGRSAVIRYPQLFGDCNPERRKHWILQRRDEGKLTLLESKHEDNPTLFDAQGNILPEGTKRLGRLDQLTGLRYKRLRLGIWCTAEGVIFDTFDPAVHVKVRPREDFKYFIFGEDEGFTHPAVILVIGVDSDGRLHILKEFYKTGVRPELVIAENKKLHADYRPHFIAVDNSAAGLIADLQHANLPAMGAKGRIIDRINNVQDLLAIRGDGRPGITVDPSCVETINEFESWPWADNAKKDTPQDIFNHCMDALGYAVDTLENGHGTPQIFV